MTREEAINELKILKEDYWDHDGYGHETKQYNDTMLALDMAINALEQEPCEDAISREAAVKERTKTHACVCISRQAVLDEINKVCFSEEWAKFRVDYGSNGTRDCIINYIRELPPVTPQPEIGRCKDCRYFEYDSLAKVDGIPLIVAHEICKRWGDGCKTKEDGYCFLFELKKGEEKE